MYDIFIAYKSEEVDLARKVSEGLAKSGYRVWWAAHLFAGQNFYKDVYKVIDQVKAVVVIWSEQSIESDWVFNEAVYAEKQGKLVPVVMGSVEPPAHFHQYHHIDIEPWIKNSDSDRLGDLLRSVSAKLDREPPSDIGDQDKITANMQLGDFEAQYWTTINRDENQTIELYQNYLEKFEPNPVFKELAEQKIENLKSQKYAAFISLFKKVGTGILILAGVVGIAAGSLQISDRIQEDRQEIATSSGQPGSEGLTPVGGNDASPQDEADKEEAPQPVDEDTEKQTQADPEVKKVPASPPNVEAPVSQNPSPTDLHNRIDRSLPTLRVYAGRIDAARIQEAVQPLRVPVSVRSRKACLSGTPATALWPDQSVKFADFKEIAVVLMDAGFKFYVIHPKFQPAPNVIDIGSIVDARTCSLNFSSPPISRTEILAAQHFCAGFRPSQTLPPEIRADQAKQLCFSR